MPVDNGFRYNYTALVVCEATTNGNPNQITEQKAIKVPE